MSREKVYASIDVEFGRASTQEAIGSLSLAQQQKLRAYWVDRASGELTTALTFEFMLEDLTREGLPAEVLHLARAAIEDEHRHVDWCLKWARALPGELPADARLGGTRPLTFEGASDHDNRLLRTVFGCCFSETVAIHILRASHRFITLDSVKHLNQQHLKEEVSHARLGWALVGWPLLRDRDRDMIGTYVSEMIRLTRMVWLSTERGPDEALHRLGYLSSAIVGPACEDAIHNVVLPGLDYLGIRAGV